MMSSTQRCPLAERQNINADSRSGGGGSQQPGPVGLLFKAPKPLSRTAGTEGSYPQFRRFSIASKTLATTLTDVCGTYFKSTAIFTGNLIEHFNRSSYIGTYL